LSLIHDAEYFSKEEILSRAKKYEFPNPLAVEIFLWDCELAAQFQDVNDEIVLKGGAATQLHLPLERQRGSRDIDLIAPFGRDDIAAIIERVKESVGTRIEFSLHEPKKPVPKLPLITYFAKMPTTLDLTREELEIKIDLLLERFDIPTVLLENVQTFALVVNRMKCLTVGALLGDKLLTLARGSIGMPLESDYPKQIYDIDALLECHEVSKQYVSEMIESIKILTEFEASLRGIEVTPQEALNDVAKTMDEYSLIDTSGGNLEVKKNIEGFQQFFVNQSQRCPLYGWSSKSLKIRFLALLLREHLENKMSETDVAEIITRSKNIALRLSKISGDAVVETRKKLLRLAETKIKYFKEMKGKPLDRVFWQIVTPTNIQEAESLT